MTVMKRLSPAGTCQVLSPLTGVGTGSVFLAALPFPRTEWRRISALNLRTAGVAPIWFDHQ